MLIVAGNIFPIVSVLPVVSGVAGKTVLRIGVPALIFFLGVGENTFPKRVSADFFSTSRARVGVFAQPVYGRGILSK